MWTVKPRVDIHILQGERELANDNRSLARFRLKIPPLPAGVPRIEVTFLIDANGILNVMAKDMRTGETQSMEVKPSYGLSDQEVERMIEDSFKFAADDVSARKLIEARLDAERSDHHDRKIIGRWRTSCCSEVRSMPFAMPSRRWPTPRTGSIPVPSAHVWHDLEQTATSLTVAMLDDSSLSEDSEEKNSLT